MNLSKECVAWLPLHFENLITMNPLHATCTYSVGQWVGKEESLGRARKKAHVGFG